MASSARTPHTFCVRVFYYCGVYWKDERRDLLIFMKRIDTQKRRLLRRLIVFLIILSLITAGIGITYLYLLYTEKTITDSIRAGDIILAPRIATIDKLAYEAPTKLLEFVSGKSMAAYRVDGILDSEEIERIVADIDHLLHNEIITPLSVDWYSAADKSLSRTYIDAQGTLIRDWSKESSEFIDFFLHGSVLESGQTYMGKVFTTRDLRTDRNVRALSYATPVYMHDGTLLGVSAITLPLEAYFRDFTETDAPTSLFVLDGGGTYLWNNQSVDSDKRLLSDLFSDFPEGYPDILAGRGEKRVMDQGDAVQVRTLHPSFEVTIDGVPRQINSQETPPEHRKWIIGYRE